ncbi:hypothetical protein DHC50_14480 [Arenibacter sp. A80]|nr:hypothetical protein [Arenibacter sp. A80]RFT55228.1 hypothetical protein D0S24_14475 [Arenibacter sp. P308M17]
MHNFEILDETWFFIYEFLNAFQTFASTGFGRLFFYVLFYVIGILVHQGNFIIPFELHKCL